MKAVANSIELAGRFVNRPYGSGFAGVRRSISVPQFKGTPRPSRGFCICGQSPCLLAALKARLYDLALARGLLLATRERVYIFHRKLTVKLILF